MENDTINLDDLHIQSKKEKTFQNTHPFDNFQEFDENKQFLQESLLNQTYLNEFDYSILQKAQRCNLKQLFDFLVQNCNANDETSTYNDEFADLQSVDFGEPRDFKAKYYINYEVAELHNLQCIYYDILHPVGEAPTPLPCEPESTPTSAKQSEEGRESTSSSIEVGDSSDSETEDDKDMNEVLGSSDKGEVYPEEQAVGRVDEVYPEERQVDDKNITKEEDALLAVVEEDIMDPNSSDRGNEESKSEVYPEEREEFPPKIRSGLEPGQEGHGSPPSSSVRGGLSGLSIDSLDRSPGPQEVNVEREGLPLPPGTPEGDANKNEPDTKESIEEPEEHKQEDFKEKESSSQSSPIREGISAPTPSIETDEKIEVAPAQDVSDKDKEESRSKKRRKNSIIHKGFKTIVYIITGDKNATFAECKIKYDVKHHTLLIKKSNQTFQIHSNNIAASIISKPKEVPIYLKISIFGQSTTMVLTFDDINIANQLESLLNSKSV